MNMHYFESNAPILWMKAGRRNGCIEPNRRFPLRRIYLRRQIPHNHIPILRARQHKPRMPRPTIEIDQTHHVNTKAEAEKPGQEQTRVSNGSLTRKRRK